MGVKKTGSRTRWEAGIVCLLGGGKERGREGGATIWLPNNRAALSLGTRFSSRMGTSLSLFSFSLPLLFTNQSTIYFFFSVYKSEYNILLFFFFSRCLCTLESLSLLQGRDEI